MCVCVCVCVFAHTGVQSIGLVLGGVLGGLCAIVCLVAAYFLVKRSWTSKAVVHTQRSMSTYDGPAKPEPVARQKTFELSVDELTQPQSNDYQSNDWQ